MGKKPLKAQFEELEISAIQVNDYNPNEMSPKAYRKLVEEIQANGFLSGVLVYREGDHFVVVDGEHRLLAGREAGLKKIPAFVLNRKPSRAEAIRITLKMNALRGEWDRGKLRENLSEVIELNEIGPDDIKEDLAGLDLGLDRVIKEIGSQGLDEKAREDIEAVERELKLSEKVKELIRKALIEGNGSIVKNYLNVIDKDTGREMFFLFEQEADPVRQAILVETGEKETGFDGHVLSQICRKYLSTKKKPRKSAKGRRRSGG